MTHLTERTCAGLLAGTLPPDEARALALHLETACPACEELLASRSAADGLDGRIDAALGGLDEGAAPGNDLEFARITRRLRERPAPARRPRPAAAPALAAAAVLVVGLAGAVALRDRGDDSRWDGLKGSAAQAPSIRLRFLVVAPEPGGAPRLLQGVSGQAVPRDASLQFEVDAARPAQAALVRVPVRGAPELVWSESVPGGRAAVTLGGRPAAYPLAGLDGPQRFVLVGGDELGPERLGRVAAALATAARPGAAPDDAAALRGLAVDAVDVDVR